MFSPLYQILVWPLIRMLPLLGYLSSKVKLFNESRANEKDLFANFVRPEGKLYWFHCASLGEYEQARPMIQALSKRDGNFTLITFFSPSGYEIVKPKELPNSYISYLPLEAKKEIIGFIDKIKPDMVFWVKYEFWFMVLQSIFRHKIPCYLISANFSSQHFITKFWAAPWRNLLKKFTRIFVQNESSNGVLARFGIPSTVAGDTRFENVQSMAEEGYENKQLEYWINEKFLVVAGSSWKGEEARMIAYLKKNPGIKAIIAPHDIRESNIWSLQDQLAKNQITYSLWEQPFEMGNQVVVLNNIGLLSKVYKYANMAFVGGGYKKGLHNILEPLAWGVPVITGPNIQNNWEALEAESLGLLTVIQEQGDIERVYNDHKNPNDQATKAVQFVSKYGSASQTILNNV